MSAATHDPPARRLAAPDRLKRMTARMTPAAHDSQNKMDFSILHLYFFAKKADYNGKFHHNIVFESILKNV